MNMKQSSKTFLDTSTSIHSIFTLEIRKVNSPLTLYCQTSQNVPRECIYQHMSEFLTQSACPRTSEVKWRSKFTIYFIFFNHLLIYLVFFFNFLWFFQLRQFLFTKNTKSYHETDGLLPMATKRDTCVFFISFISYGLLNSPDLYKNQISKTF